MRKSLILAIFVFVLAFSTGCKNTLPALPVPPADNAKEENIPEYSDITDPAELKKLWQEYIYDSIATIGNTREFHSAEEIDPLYVAEFCWFKYVSEHGKESLELADKDSSLRLFPLDTVLTYAKRYFNLTSLDVSKIDEHVYDPLNRAFLFDIGSSKETRPSYLATNAWGDQLGRVTKSRDGTVTVILVHAVLSSSNLTELTKTFTLKEREDGSLYFTSGKWEYINNHLVSLTGNYQQFDKISGFEGTMDALSALGDADGRLILAFTPYEKGKNAALMLVNPETMTVEKMLEVNGAFSPTDVSATKENIFIRLNDRIIAVDKTLSHSEEIMLPSIITEKINRKPKYNEKGSPDIFFGGYDMSEDAEQYVYADEVGLKLYHTSDNKEKLLSKSVPIIGSELIDTSFHSSPRFVSDEQKVITTMTAYEGTLGYTLCDLKGKDVTTYKISSEASSTSLIRHDTGLLEINSYVRNRNNEEDEYQTLYLDFHTGKVQEIPLVNPGDTGYIRMPDSYYVGQNYAAFITNKWDNGDNTNNVFYLNRLNLETLQIEPQIVSVKAADTHILGVLADGRVVFWYYLNPVENGICITK